MNLFRSSDFLPPLAERLRPKNLTEFTGQPHLLEEDKPLRNMLDSKFIRSMILWGPPGSGKTTLAGIIANTFDYEFYGISAVSAGVKELREVIGKADISLKHYKKPVILFIDEIHRFNKSQQDLLLHSIEEGSLILIGATTENPSFEINSPILSRVFIFVLNPLSEEDLNKITDRALNMDEILGKKNIILEKEARNALVRYSGSDARIMLNALEIAVNLAKQGGGGEIVLTAKIIEEACLRKSKYDKTGEEHYNTISAFIKSIRGSDPDGAVFWLAKMLDAGEDIKFIARRLIILASEDIGNAEPDALSLAVSCFNAVQVIGMPEARIVLSQATVYLAGCPKSNASYIAIEEALKDTGDFPGVTVPLHLRNAPTKLMKDLDYHKGYKYSHDYKNHFTEQLYLPAELSFRIYYRPQDSGKEKELKARLKLLWGKNKDYGD
ncbi:MAG: replication-associated recombination protein A [Deltaproteobacteria bacterium]|nr:replication-associated recombination protein A [Deltaproteobacteria bacterium]